jgi:hypothetical protein
MDESLQHLIDLWKAHGTSTGFELTEPSFALTMDGMKWLKQVNIDPPKFIFSAEAIKVIHARLNFT